MRFNILIDSFVAYFVLNRILFVKASIVTSYSIFHITLKIDKLRDGAPSAGGSGASGSGGPVFGVPLSQCVEAAPWRKRSACTSTSTTGIDIPEITSPTASKASRSDSRISVGSTISVQDRVSTFLVCF